MERPLRAEERLRLLRYEEVSRSSGGEESASQVGCHVVFTLFAVLNIFPGSEPVCNTF